MRHDVILSPSSLRSSRVNYAKDLHHHTFLLLLASALIPRPAAAQIRASEIGGFTQTIDGTRIAMNYSRPRARGRDTLFGSPKAVRWDEVWTPGANWATTLDVSKPVKLDGHEVKKGTYSVWMIVRRSGDWTIVLDPKVKIYHMDPPDSNAAQVRFAIKPHDAPQMDVLSWWMPDVRANGGTLAMQWGRTRVDMNLEVQPSLTVELAESEARPYMGQYEYTEKDDAGKSTPKKFFIVHEQGTMKAYMEPADRYMGRFALIRITRDWFAPGLYDEKGNIYEVLRPDMVLEFRRQAGKVVSFDVRGEDDKIFATGKRLP